MFFTGYKRTFALTIFFFRHLTSLPPYFLLFLIPLPLFIFLFLFLSSHPSLSLLTLLSFSITLPTLLSSLSTIFLFFHAILFNALPPPPSYSFIIRLFFVSFPLPFFPFSAVSSSTFPLFYPHLYLISSLFPNTYLRHMFSHFLCLSTYFTFFFLLPSIFPFSHLIPQSEPCNPYHLSFLPFFSQISWHPHYSHLLVPYILSRLLHSNFSSCCTSISLLPISLPLPLLYFPPYASSFITQTPLFFYRNLFLLLLFWLFSFPFLLTSSQHSLTLFFLLFSSLSLYSIVLLLNLILIFSFFFFFSNHNYLMQLT